MTSHALSDYRGQAIRIITDCNSHSRGQLLEAVFKLRHHGKNGDESVLRPLLNHSDDGVVASALTALVDVFGQLDSLRTFIIDAAQGDSRDVGQMPIQSTAISLLAQMVRSDKALLALLLQIAEDADVAEVPSKRAWQCLAEIAGIEWSPEFSEYLIDDPSSEQSLNIKSLIRRAFN